MNAQNTMQLGHKQGEGFHSANSREDVSVCESMPLLVPFISHTKIQIRPKSKRSFCSLAKLNVTVI